MVQPLSTKAHWDAIHEDGDWAELRGRGGGTAPHRSLWRRIKNAIKALLGPHILGYLRSYPEYILWHVIYDRHMPRGTGARAVEIGSAPGTHLVRLHQQFGFAVHGIEYSPKGAELNRRIFAAHDIDPDNVIQADFFSETVSERYRGYFDAVVSRGFVEHFTDVGDVVRRHVELLKPGGRLFVSIPNLRGANYIVAWLFNRPVLAIHNLEIMRKQTFSDVFGQHGLETLYCGYYGTFDFSLYNAPRHSPMRRVLDVCLKLQLVLNVLFRLLFGAKGAESRWFSPCLIYVGTKPLLKRPCPATEAKCAGPVSSN